MITKSLSGFSLTEIMVALALSAILMMGVLQIMSSSKRTYALQDELAKLQDNARFVMEELAYNIRMGGYFGCSMQSPTNEPPFESENDQVIRNENENELKVDGFPGSDTLTLRSYKESLLLEPEPTQLFDSDIAAGITLRKGSVMPEPGEDVMVSDCGSSVRYRVTKTTSNTLFLTPLRLKTGEYKWPIEIFPASVATTTYFVRWLDENGNGQFEPEEGFGLFKQDSGGEQLLAEGVENLQVRYGIVVNNNLQYQNDISGGSAKRVVSVRITFLMRTLKKRIEIKGATNRSFQLDPGIIYNPQERDNEHGGNYEEGYRHRLFTTTLQVRNQWN